MRFNAIKSVLGFNNTINSSAQCSAIGGGATNSISSAYSCYATIAGGFRNVICKNAGSGNALPGQFIGGGQQNTASAVYDTIGGGFCNSLSSPYGCTFIGGGSQNCIGGNGGESSLIVGGFCNTISSTYTTNDNIVGGACNTISSLYGDGHNLIGHGFRNTISGYYADYSTIVGGCCNTIGGFCFSSILGGKQNTVNAYCQFIIGSNITAPSTNCTTYMNNATVACHLQVGGLTTMNSTTGRIDASNDVVAFATSDKRLKCNIKPIENALCKVIGVTGNTFDWKELTKEEIQTIHGNTGRDVGVIAQEIESILPEAVTTRESGYKAVNYEKIIPLLIEAIKEQQKQIDELKSRL